MSWEPIKPRMGVRRWRGAKQAVTVSVLSDSRPGRRACTLMVYLPTGALAMMGWQPDAYLTVEYNKETRQLALLPPGSTTAARWKLAPSSTKCPRRRLKLGIASGQFPEAKCAAPIVTADQGRLILDISGLWQSPPMAQTIDANALLLDAAGVAAALQISEATVLRWAHAGTFPKPTLIHARTMRWARDVVLAWIDEQAERAALQDAQQSDD